MLDFWFDFASSYSHVGALRIEAAARVAGVKLRWRPFLLGPVFQAQLGIKDSPFNNQPVRKQYMKRDLERLCSKYGFPAFKLPEVFPQRSVLANRIACVALDEPWVGDFIRQTFRAQFADGKDISKEDVLGPLLVDLAVDPAPVLAAANAEPAKQLLRANTDEAQKLGLFGAPNCVVNGELFFGQDRIDDALEWALKKA